MLTSAYRADYLERNPEENAEDVGEAYIVRYYGRYDGAYAVWIQFTGLAYTTNVTYTRVNGLVFINWKGVMCLDGTCYDLKDFYEQGLISDEALNELYAFYRTTAAEIYQEFEDRYGPLPTGESANGGNSSQEENFSDNEIIVILRGARGEAEYSAEDFEDVGCIAFTFLSDCHDKQDQIALLTLDVHSRENVTEKIAVLSEREDVLSAEKNFNVSAD